MSFFQVQPAGAYFPPPHNTRGVRNTLFLTNTGTETLVFKVRSSNPERFVVKPTAGFIGPTSAARIIVTLKRTDTDLSGCTKDRFRISVKAAAKMEGHPANRNDAKHIWESLKDSPMLSESDIMCSYGADVPANATVTFVAADAEDVAASEAAASPQTARGVPANQSVPPSSGMSAANRVSFGGEGGASKTAVARGGGSATPSATAGDVGAATGTVRSVSEGLANAQRLKESVQTDIASLKERERMLNEQIAARNATSDGLSREALELERLRAKVSQARQQLAERTAAASGATGAAATPSATIGRSPGVSLEGTSSKIDSRTAESSTGSDGAEGATGRKAPKSGRTSVYLSTVLLWMLLAYVGGAVFRVVTNPHDGDGWTAALPEGVRQTVHDVLRSVRTAV
mmetsp:Transcript_66007/g.76678  ORF Transcript_66007/g.76678 Transcript_66007/m.76678 type:complete len:402 (+) Transcript_66007:109-1314(+)|eukprot:CAMPEP_0176435096 /NCGR_PEP_ID=MMETSP0127-20121128/17097_1 /TAXON_ID=938130 /ORGANISM="Platyophrya macrostoma, Strain WH" /LENGTH=401 /DNA_ID=CAMNT_0017818015 /DNA_START=109 /DNA_END=1314 /DNA_ORIENTATION=+